MTSSKSQVAVGFALTAAILMMFAGVIDILQGLAAIIRNHYYVIGTNYVYKINVTTWGWIHLILGLGLGVTGFSCSAGRPGPALSASSRQL
jgi:hypothetical protein